MPAFAACDRPRHDARVPIVLFDIDLTLIHTNGAGRLAMDRVLCEWFAAEEPTAGISFDGRTDRAIFEDALLKLGDPSPEAFARLVGGYLAGLPAALEERGGHLLPGVADLLAALETERLPLGLATGNMRPGAMAKLAYFGLDGRFRGGGFGDGERVRAKLVAAGIVEVAGLFGLPPHPAEAIVLGDTPLDIEAAHLAGARAIGVATGRFSLDELREAGADAAFGDLSDTEAVLAVLRGG